MTAPFTPSDLFPFKSSSGDYIKCGEKEEWEKKIWVMKIFVKIVKKKIESWKIDGALTWICIEVD